MSLHNRIRKLEVIHRTDETGHTCGAPATLAPAYIITTNLDPLPRCTGCERPLNEDGRPMPRIYKRVVLPHGNPIRDAVAPD
jgi:hypothetical protein